MRQSACCTGSRAALCSRCRATPRSRPRRRCHVWAWDFAFFLSFGIGRHELGGDRRRAPRVQPADRTGGHRLDLLDQARSRARYRVGRRNRRLRCRSCGVVRARSTDRCRDGGGARRVSAHCRTRQGSGFRQPRRATPQRACSGRCGHCDSAGSSARVVLVADDQSCLPINRSLRWSSARRE